MIAVHRRVAITGVGSVNAAFVGGTPELVALLRRTTPPAMDASLAMVADAALPVLVDAGEQRRMSRVSRLTVAAATLAIADAGVADAEIGIVVGTESGDLRSTIEFANGFLERGPAGLSALAFPNTVMNTMAATTAIAIRARAASVTLNAPVVAGDLAVARAAAAIAAGRLDVALAAGVDQIDPLERAVGARLAGDAGTRGEGATVLVLEPLEAAERRGAAIRGEIRSWSWRALPARTCGVGRATDARVIAGALAAACAGAHDVAAVYDSASGDRRRDAWEDALLEAALPQRPPTASLALLLGHHAGLGPLRVASAAWTARTGRLAGGAATVAHGPVLSHAIAPGGTHVAIVVGATDGSMASDGADVSRG